MAVDYKLKSKKSLQVQKYGWILQKSHWAAHQKLEKKIPVFAYYWTSKKLFNNIVLGWNRHTAFILELEQQQNTAMTYYKRRLPSYVEYLTKHMLRSSNSGSLSWNLVTVYEQSGLHECYFQKKKQTPLTLRRPLQTYCHWQKRLLSNSTHGEMHNYV